MNNSMKTATLLRHDGTQEPITPKNGKYFTLQEMQTAVGGYIDILSPPGDVVFVINDDGKAQFPKNVRATLLWMTTWFAGVENKDDLDFQGDFLAGDVIMAPSNMVR
jgi:Domain of unknown function (DUF3846)